MVVINTAGTQMVVEESEYEIRFSHSAEPGHDLDEIVVFPGYQGIKVAVSRDFAGFYGSILLKISITFN